MTELSWAFDISLTFCGWFRFRVVSPLRAYVLRAHVAQSQLFYAGIHAASVLVKPLILSIDFA